MKNIVILSVSFVISALTFLYSLMAGHGAGKGLDPAPAVQPGARKPREAFRKIEQKTLAPPEPFTQWLASENPYEALRAARPKAAHVYEFMDFHTHGPPDFTTFALSPADS